MARQNIINESVPQINKIEKNTDFANFFGKRVNKGGFTYATLMVVLCEENSIVFDI